MSEQSVDLVRHAFEVYDTQGIEAALPFFAADVVWYPTDRWLDGDAYRGHAGMRTVNAEWAANFDDWRWAVHEIRDAGERVVGLVEMTGLIKGTEMPLSRPLGLVVSDIHDGTLGTIRAYPSWQEALTAAGLEE